MSNTTKYEVQTATEEGEFETVATRSRKDAALAEAEHVYDEADQAIRVRVMTDAGNVVHELEAIVREATDEGPATAKAVRRTRPWSRVEEPKFDAPELDDYTLAYSRTRTETAVYRKNDKTGWLVLHVPTGERWETENTTEAREITNGISNKFREQAKLAADEAKQVAEAARIEKKRLRDEAKQAADKEREAKREAREAAKVEKEVEAEVETDTEDETDSAPEQTDDEEKELVEAES